jgi:hypothetical protein
MNMLMPKQRGHYYIKNFSDPCSKPSSADDNVAHSKENFCVKKTYKFKEHYRLQT